MKKFLVGLTALVLILTVTLGVSAAEVAKMRLKTSADTAYRGDKITITVSLTNDQAVEKGGVVLSYDTAVFQLVGGECKVKNAALGEVSQDKNGGVFAMAEDTVVSGTIFTIQLQVKDDAPFGEYTISGSPSLSGGGENISCSLSGTMVTVACKHDFQNCVEIDEDEHESTCSICGEKIQEEHTWDKGTVTQKPTCQVTGKKDVTCTGCGTMQEKTVSLLPHTCTYENLETGGHRFTCQKCGETGIESHSYQDEWGHDENGHYHACAECGYQRDKASHTPGPAATETTSQLCTVCSRVLQTSMNHDHTFTNEWVSDENGHWYKCAECDATRDMAEHTYDNACDEACNICGMTRQPPHEIGDWQTDGANHWKSCSRCGEKAELGGHAASEEDTTTCKICGKSLLGEHKHKFDSAHTHVCDCGETQEGTAQFCKVCGTFPWWVLCIAEAVLFAGVLLIVHMRKKGGYTEEPEEEEEGNLKILLGFFQNASEKIKVCYNVEKRRKDEYYTGALFHERVFWHWWIYPPGRGVFILAAFDLCDFVDGRHGAVRRMAGKSLQGKIRKQQKQGADLDGLFN